VNDNFRDHLYTIDKKGHRKWVYADLVEGFWVVRRKIVAYTLILLYLSMPWVSINGKQAVLPGGGSWELKRRMHLCGWVLRSYNGNQRKHVSVHIPACGHACVCTYAYIHTCVCFYSI